MDEKYHGNSIEVWAYNRSNLGHRTKSIRFVYFFFDSLRPSQQLWSRWEGQFT